MTTELCHHWAEKKIAALFDLPFGDLMLEAHLLHGKNFPANEVQMSTLLSIKTGTCPEDCQYCPQSGHYKTGLEKEKLLDLEKILSSAKKAKETGATRFCMGAAWRSIPKKELPQIVTIIREVKALGLETCMTLGMLGDEETAALKEAGLDYYNHNIDTSPDYYKEIVSTRCFQDRLDTLERVRQSGINVCCGGIVGMGESREDRVKFLQQLANLPEHPQSVPINRLIAVPGTPLQDQKQLDDFEFIRTVAVARILMPKSFVRLSAGRESMSETMQAWCFFAGANSVHYGEKLLTTPNPDLNQDLALFKKLGLKAASASV